MNSNPEFIRDGIKMLFCSAAFFIVSYYFYDSGEIVSRGVNTNSVDKPFEFWSIVLLFITGSIISFIYSLSLFIKYFEEDNSGD
ncbi:hypothetical protein [Pseudoalteromonas spongiae]|uniref:hypothetical protein n=1 Tax=Pseudoalteromonas spongiae TaxID=298657 RepID=UPI000C2D63CB|nr:hypothetical protein [Pseudoalteromonas spongiae]